MRPLRGATRGVLVIGMVLALAAARGAAAPLPMPTAADLQQMYDAGQYHTCLQQIARVLPNADRPGSGFDRFQLMLLRGECLMRLAERPQAYRAFMTAQESPDTTTALTARANVLIIDASDQFNYRPPGGGDAIDIRDPANRRKAMAALFDAEYDKARGQIDTAKEAPSLGPIINVVPKLKDLVALEMTATSNDAVIRPALSGIGARARNLIAGALKQVDAQVAEVQGRANESAVVVPVSPGSPWWTNAGRRGLDTNDRRRIQDAIDSADAIYNATLKGCFTAKALHGEVEMWNALVNRARETAYHARAVLDAE